jgi:[ribosomal protein S18]-alanine N-acetyltransferase
MEIIKLSPEELHDESYIVNITNFLFDHLGKYGDPREHIRAAIDYSLSQQKGRGGFVIVAQEAKKILGAVVVNETGMVDYIPSNILVYIAVDEAVRGKGIGKRLMEEAISNATGGIALHVEADNPAKKLYEKLGFTNKYLEMRLQQ